MTPAKLRELAEYHQKCAEDARGLEGRMHGEVAAGFSRRAARHEAWALGLRELAATMEAKMP